MSPEHPNQMDVEEYCNVIAFNKPDVASKVFSADEQRCSVTLFCFPFYAVCATHKNMPTAMDVLAYLLSVVNVRQDGMWNAIAEYQSDGFREVLCENKVNITGLEE